MTLDKIKGIAFRLSAVAISALWFWGGFQVGGQNARRELAEARTEWQEEREKATASALAESEAQRIREKNLTEKLARATKEHNDVQTRLAAAVADRGRIDSQLRDARAAITAALNSKEWSATAPCIRAADTTFEALGRCSEAYRGVAGQYGSCLAGMQLIEKTYNAARETCR